MSFQICIEFFCSIYVALEIIQSLSVKIILPHPVSKKICLQKTCHFLTCQKGFVFLILDTSFFHQRLSHYFLDIWDTNFWFSYFFWQHEFKTVPSLHLQRLFVENRHTKSQGQGKKWLLLRSWCGLPCPVPTTRKWDTPNFDYVTCPYLHTNSKSLNRGQAQR